MLILLLKCFHFQSLTAIRCPRLSSPTNGRVEALQRTPGSVASYSCNDGYTLRGAQSRLCRSSGQWSGQEPVCVGEW